MKMGRTWILDIRFDFIFSCYILFLAGAIRVPTGFAMIGSGVFYLAGTGKDIGLASEQILQGLCTNFVFLSVPLCCRRRGRSASISSISASSSSST